MRRIGGLLLGLGLLSGCASDIAVGRAAYMAHCTDCHGVSGAGDGRLAAFSRTGTMPDLTGLSGRWGGAYPEAYVVRAVGAPGEVHRRVSAMPDFAELLAGAPVLYTLPGGATVPTTETVLALAAYLETLQE